MCYNNYKGRDFMKDKINYKNLNELIQTGRILLKICLIVAIGSLVVLGFLILEKTQVIDFIFTILKIIFPLFIGLLVAWLFEPLISKLEKKKFSRLLSTIIVYISFLFFIILMIVLVVPEFVSQLKELIGQMPAFLSKAQDFITNFLSNFSESEFDIESIKTEISLQLENTINSLTTNSLTGILNGITNFLSEGFNVVLGILIGFYLSLGFNNVGSGVSAFVPRKYKGDLKTLLSELNEMARDYVSGTLFTSLIVAFLTFLGLVISGVGSPLLFAVFCGVTNIIPYFGPYIGGIPVIVVGFSVSPMCGFICLITIVLVQFVEGNIIHPLIVGKAIDLHPVIILIGLLIFEYFLGILGMILAAPIMGAIKIIFNFYNKKYQLIEKIKPDKLEVN